MRNFNRIGMTVVLGSALGLFSASAQTINQRRENQQDRIARGVKSGQLTAGETSNLEKKESAFNQGVRTDRALNGGKLTNGENKIASAQQNQMSKQIYNDKHNGVTQHYGNNKIDAHRENQQDRIANGIASGTL